MRGGAPKMLIASGLPRYTSVSPSLDSQAILGPGEERIISSSPPPSAASFDRPDLVG